jgi:hypothetical protein
MAKEIRNAFSGFGRELLGNIRESAQDRLDDAAFEERIVGIENATASMIELGVEEDKIINMLQKYWDLRLSEAKEFVDRQRKQ